MKIVQINVTCGEGSTGKICVAISRLLTENKIENYILYASGSSDYPLGICYADKAYIKRQALKSHSFGNYGFQSRSATEKLLQQLDRIQPDIIHLHNLHGHNVNLTMLFEYVKEHRIKAVWTFHDCWAFTAYCPHFTMAKCEQWKTGCTRCPQIKEYSFFLERSSEQFNKKKAALQGVELTVVTPSKWLEGMVKQSFLKDVPVKVINNGIDLSVFRPAESDFRERNHIPEDKFVVLGVAFGWGKRKGLDVFTELSKRLDADKFQIVLVGTNEKLDRELPDNIISIHRTRNQQELAEIYTAADLLVNPTREEVFGLVNIEALACGTPVLTFDTGGSPECLDETCGAVTECGDVDALEKEICRICSDGQYTANNCITRAKQFDNSIKFEEYIQLYKDLDE